MSDDEITVAFVRGLWQAFWRWLRAVLSEEPQ